MTITLELTTEEIDRITTAESLGVDVRQLIKSMIQGLPASASPSNDNLSMMPSPLPVGDDERRRRLLQILQDVNSRAVTDSEEEIERSEQEMNEIFADMRQWRYPDSV